MSKGYGIVQRRVLAQLTEVTADPMADFDMPPWFQSWTPLAELAGGKSSAWSIYESTRRAVAKLAAARVVETAIMYGWRWHHVPKQFTTMPPGAVQRTHHAMVLEDGPEGRRRLVATDRRGSMAPLGRPVVPLV